jgi:hypothetical protein
VTIYPSFVRMMTDVAEACPTRVTLSQYDALRAIGHALDDVPYDEALSILHHLTHDNFAVVRDGNIATLVVDGKPWLDIETPADLKQLFTA